VFSNYYLKLCLALGVETNEQSLRTIIIIMSAIILCIVCAIVVVLGIYFRRQKKVKALRNTEGKDRINNYYDDSIAENYRENVNPMQHEMTYEEIQYNSYEDINYYAPVKSVGYLSITEADVSRSNDGLPTYLPILTHSVGPDQYISLRVEDTEDQSTSCCQSSKECVNEKNVLQ